eukprot:Skav203644  [mRNA]  locus=scaffold1120:374302:375204:+ [translate_table: standard]
MVSQLALTKRAAQVLLYLGAPLVLLHVCDYIAQHVDSGALAKRDLHCLDLFAGAQAVTNGFVGEGLKAASFDLALHGDLGDITSVLRPWGQTLHSMRKVSSEASSSHSG